MRNFLHTDEFENYLQQQIKNHRMYPSDYIWRNIQLSLHGETNWPALSFISIFIIAALTIGTVLIKPNDKLLLEAKHPPASAEAVMANEKQENKATIAIEQHLSSDRITEKTISDASNNLMIINKIPALSNTTALIPVNSPVSIPVNSTEDNTSKSTGKNQGVYLSQLTGYTASSTFENGMGDEVSNFNIYSFNAPEKNAIAFNQPYNFPIGSLNYSDDVWRTFPVTNFSSSSHKKYRWEYQVYATPSVSFRILYDADNKQPARNFIPAIPAQGNYYFDVNQAVRHTPAIGFELGGTIGYKLTNQITLKTGLQFNKRQYNIQAYRTVSTSTQPITPSSFATDISLTDSTQTENFTYRNALLAPQSYPVTLSNRYYEVSVPFAIDWKVLNLHNFTWAIAGSVQPTYTFNRQPFIITSDYKNYADGASLMRKWNVNTSLETYISYKNGDYIWQLGPQFRYQQLPTYLNQYPVKEYLFDYGIKLGLTKSIKR